MNQSEDDPEAELKKLFAELDRKSDQARPARQLFLVSLIVARQKKGLSQAGLARLLNKQQPAIARIESGKGNPGLNTLLSIAKALDVNLMLE